MKVFWAFLKNLKWSKIVKKLSLTRLILQKFGHFWDFFQSPFSGEIYVQWSSNEAKNDF